MRERSRSRGAYARALEFCRARRLVEPGARVLVGTAGGAASLGVLGFLTLAQRALELGEVAVACVDGGAHGDDPEFVAETGRLARVVGVTFHAVSARGAKGPSAIRAALRAHARDCGYDRVALGHTRDDAVAHVLAALVHDRGGPIAPLAARRRDGLVRPLLGLRESEALELARTAGLEPPALIVPDPGERVSLELRLRRTVLPRLRVEAAGVDEALLRVAQRMASLERTVRAHAQAELERAPRAPDGRTAQLQVREGRSRAERDALAREALGAAGVALRGAEYVAARAHLSRLLAAPGGERKSSATRREPRTVVLAPGLVATLHSTPGASTVTLRRLRDAIERSKHRG